MELKIKFMQRMMLPLGITGCLLMAYPTNAEEVHHSLSETVHCIQWKRFSGKMTPSAELKLTSQILANSARWACHWLAKTYKENPTGDRLIIPNKNQSNYRLLKLLYKNNNQNNLYLLLMLQMKLRHNLIQYLPLMLQTKLRLNLIQYLLLMHQIKVRHNLIQHLPLMLHPRQVKLRQIHLPFQILNL